jgi:GNAT superfamily N-acetyltransferase
MVRLARISDIPRVQAIQRANLFSRRGKSGKATLEGRGFLLYATPRRSFAGFVNDRENNIFLVDGKNGKVLGYFLVHDMGMMLRKKPERWVSMIAAHGRVKKLLRKGRVAVTYQIAKEPSAEGSGKRLMRKMLAYAKGRGYCAIACQIASSPYRNARSEALHRNFGFVPCGSHMEHGFGWHAWVKTL